MVEKLDSDEKNIWISCLCFAYKSTTRIQLASMIWMEDDREKRAMSDVSYDASVPPFLLHIRQWFIIMKILLCKFDDCGSQCGSPHNVGKINIIFFHAPLIEFEYFSVSVATHGHEPSTIKKRMYCNICEPGGPAMSIYHTHDNCFIHH
jgi:hypothetical protein